MLRNLIGSTGARAVIAGLMLLFVFACSGSDSGLKQGDVDAAAAAAAEQARLDAEAAAAAAAEMAEMDRLAKIEGAKQAIAAATTEAEAQAAKDAVNDVATALEAVALQAAVDAQIAALATMASADAQRMALMTAAGAIDTSDLMTQQNVDAANGAIAALKMALAAATDVSDADKAMYQGQVDAAETAVAAAQSSLDHAAQTPALTSAVTALQAIDLTDLSTQDAIDAANTAIAAVRTALAAATELSASEKTMAMTELATADRTVMVAQGRFDTAAQKTALDGAVAILAALDLDNLMTQEQIDAAVGAITALDLALAAATSLTDAEKLDATVDVTVAKRKVERAETTLATNVGSQRMALTTAGTALAALDLDDLDTQEKIDTADAAVEALEMALAAATHLSDSEKATYQTQLDTATETVRTAQTGMDRDGRMMAQRTAIMNAVTMVRTAVAGVKDTSTDSEVDAADAAVKAVKDAIAAAEDLSADDAEIIKANAVLATIEPLLANAKTSRTAYLADKGDEDMKAMAATGKALHAALGGPAEDNNALNNIAAPTLSAAGLVIDAAAGAGAFDATDDPNPDPVTLKAGDSAGALGSWNGMDYVPTTGTGDDKVTNEARVYTNRGEPETDDFGDVHVLTDGSLEVTDANLNLVRAADFTHSGTQNHQVPDRSDAVYVEGTYDGAPGTYSCTATCSSTNDSSGSPSDLGGTWTFTPDKGAEVSQPDAHYLYYGWWVSKDNEGNPTAASAFAGRAGTDAADDGLDVVDLTADTLTGSATYVGNAAGKFAIDNPLDGTGNGGHFTADAMLEAKFSGTDPGVTGTIDNFRLNDGSEDPGWSVSLARGGLAATGIEAPAADPTVWSINGNKAPASGTWSGTMYDEMPGDPPDGDGSNLPTTVTGTFYSEFSNIGRMVGAFGAEKQ